MATYDPFLARTFIHLFTLLSRFYSLSSLCAFNLPGGRQMFAPLPLDRTTHLSPVLPTSPLLRVSSRHFLFPSPVRSPRGPFCTLPCRPFTEDPSLPFFIVPNILTDSDHKESPREGRRREKARNPSRMVICQCQKKPTTSYTD